MSQDFYKLAKEKVKEAKREARLALREEVKNERIKEKLERLREIERKKLHKEKQKNLSIDLNEILSIYNRKGAFNDGVNAIVELEDGNIKGCVDGKYFYTYQEGGNTYIKMLEKGEDLASNYDPRDGEAIKTPCLNVAIAKVKSGNKVVTKTIMQETYRKAVAGYDIPTIYEAEGYSEEHSIVETIDNVLVNKNQR